MPRKILRLRQRAHERQQGLCHYCARSTWLGDPADFMSRHGCSQRAAQQLRSTAEHLVARQDGGKDTAENVVAACHYCNAARHRRRKPLSAEEFGLLVMQRIRTGRWFQVTPARKRQKPPGAMNLL